MKTAKNSASSTSDSLDAMENAVLGLNAFADGITAQLRDLISRTADGNPLNDDLNILLWNFEHHFGLVYRNAQERVSELLKAARVQAPQSQPSVAGGEKQEPPHRPTSPAASVFLVPAGSHLESLSGALHKIEDANLALRLWANQSFKLLWDIDGLENHPLCDWLVLNQPHLEALLKASGEAHSSACCVATEMREAQRGRASAVGA